MTPGQKWLLEFCSFWSVIWFAGVWGFIWENWPPAQEQPESEEVRDA